MPPDKFISAVMFTAMLVFFSIGTPQDALAVTMGKFEIHPFASVTETFTDNVFSTPANEKRDRVTKYSPGATLGYPFSVHRLDLSYNAVLTRYDEFRSEKTNDHHGQGALDLKFGSRIDLVLTDVYNKDHEPRSSSTTGFIQIYKTNTAMGSLVYQLADRSKVKVEYSTTSWKFRNSLVYSTISGTIVSSIFRNRNEDLVSGYVYYRFLPKTSIFIEYDVKKVDFIETTTPYDNDMTSGLLGLTWEASNQSKGTIKAGKASKAFENSALKDHKAWISSIDLKHEFTRYTSVTLAGQRIFNESNRLGARFYITTGAYGEAVHKFGYHLSALVRGSYGTDVYSDIVAPETVQRRDIILSRGGGFKYLLQEWLELSAEYANRSRNSNVDAADFKEHQYSVMISATL